MEWKEPNFNWIFANFAQVDNNGAIKVQNNSKDIAIRNAKASGYAVWEKATKKRIYPPIETPLTVDNEKIKTLLNNLIKQIQDALKEVE